MGASGGPDLVQYGLVFVVDAADKNSYLGSGTAWSNLGSSESDGTLSVAGIGTVSGSLNTMAFDGTDDYVDCGNDSSLNIQGSITAEAWINLASAPTEAGSVVVTKGNVNGGSSTVQYNLHFNTSRQLKWQLSTGSSTNTMTTTATVSIGDWTHIVGIHDASNTDSYIYINGELSATDKSSIGNLGGTAIDLAIGYDDYTDRYPFDGNISNVRIYNRVLSAAEVLQNFNAQRTRFGV